MESLNQQRSQGRKFVRQIYSPSESDTHALVLFDDSNEYGIIKYSDILTENDGKLELRSGNYASLVFLGKLINSSTLMNYMRSLDSSIK